MEFSKTTTTIAALFILCQVLLGAGQNGELDMLLLAYSYLIHFNCETLMIANCHIARSMNVTETIYTLCIQ